MNKLAPMALGILLVTSNTYAFDEPLETEVDVQKIIDAEEQINNIIVNDSTAIEVSESEVDLVIDTVSDSEGFIEEQYEDWLSSPLGSDFESMTENDDGVNYAQMHFGIATSRSSDLTMRTVRRTFEQAFENAIEKVALEGRAAVTSDRISTLSESVPDFSDYICPTSASAQKQLVQEKLIQLAEIAFRDKLSAEGVSQEAIDQAMRETAIKDKQTILEDSLKNSVNIETGWRGISSFFVQKVFMAEQEDGAVSVGVVIVKTTPAHEMIQYVTKARGDFDPNAWNLPKTFKPISRTFKTPDGEYKQFNSTSQYVRYLVNKKQDETVIGSHLVYDNNGYPTVISVSYESVNKRSSNSAEMRTYKKIAKKRATTYAMNELYRLVNLKVKVSIEVLDEVSLTKKAVANYLDCSLDSIDIEDTQINSTTDTKVTVQSKVDKLSLKGVKTNTMSFYNPFNPKQISYYSYAIWSPLQDAKQRKIESSKGAFTKKIIEVKVQPKIMPTSKSVNGQKNIYTESPELGDAQF
ncbi:putative exported protein [Aliivibrio wodanis]|uniref:Putative exported protein n=1 Tax=Aliivibrio wodanis TaxID=80852 RepID=A0A090IDD2_9GAMM|nr:putative exported protein [Aliivibrio wodanis]